MHPNVERVAAALKELGAKGQIVELPEAVRTAEAAAEKLGCPVGAIVKSLVFMAGGEPLLLLVSGDNLVDVEALSAHLGLPVRRASADEVREATGFAIGGVPPLGHRRPLPALADPALMLYDVVWAAAGTPDAVFPADPARLLEACGARQAPPEVFRRQA